MHPGFGEENPKRDVGIEEGHARVTLYVKPDHPSALLRGAQNIVNDYRIKQGYERGLSVVNIKHPPA